MRHTYIRFVTADIDRNSYKRRGLFHAIGDLVDANELTDYQLDEIQELRQWFSDELNSPDRFSWSQRPSAAPKAISWFKSSAIEHISRMHALCRILNEHGIATEMITSTKPGYLVFEDEFQVAAVPFAETAT